MKTAFVIFLRLSSLLCLHTLSSETRNITIGFDCLQNELFYECTAEGLTLTKGDLNSVVVIPETATSPQHVEIKSSKMFFIPPEIFKNFSETKEFVASGNEIEEIHAVTFKDAKNLRHLVLPSNRIKYLVDFTFSSCKDLQTLDLHHNEIESISSKAFFGLTELRSLMLSNNKIVHLPLFVFSPLRNIETLSIDNNFIAVISYNQFSRNPELTSLNLENNRIALIDNGSFENVLKLEQLELRKNLCIDFSFNVWNTTSQSELSCCYNSTDELCVVRNSQPETHDYTFLLLTLLVMAIAVNFAVLFYCFVFKRRGNLEPEDFELLNDQNGSAFLI